MIRNKKVIERVQYCDKSEGGCRPRRPCRPCRPNPIDPVDPVDP